MRDYFPFIKANFEVVLFGWLLTFFSSFGQTFLISLFVPAIQQEFALSNTVFGAYYAIATVIASFFLLRWGHVIDERPVRPFTNKTVVLLTAASLLLAFAWHPTVVFISLIGLRLGGQGLMSHISFSVMSRYFDRDRGKALSISSLGYPMGEMVFPILLGLILAAWGWRVAIGVTGILLMISLLPLLARLNLELLDQKPQEHAKNTHQDLKASRTSFISMMKEARFWVITPPVFLMSFTVTGLFFYQYLLASEKGWSVALYSLLFSGYAIARLGASLYGGILTDRLSALRLFPFYLLPLAAATLAMLLLPGLFAAAIFLLLTGVSVGLGGGIKSAVIAEIYGVDQIGKVRSLYTVVMVLGTASAPYVYGRVLDMGRGFTPIFLLSFILLALVSINSLRLGRVSQVR